MLIAGAFLMGCSGSSSSNPDACTAYQVPAGTNLMAPAVSFQSDVLPIFEGSCGLSTSCHGSSTVTSDGRVFLGSDTVTTDPATVHDGLVGIFSMDLPSMPYVTAGDPSKSFLMHKMDGDECLFASQCAASVAGGGCGVSMPQNLPLLDVASRDTVRRWIAQGAAND